MELIKILSLFFYIFHRFKFAFIFWFLARSYNLIDEIQLAKECHEKAKYCLNLFSENISGKADRKSFFNVYFNQRIMGDIKTEVIVEDPEPATSIFAFCPSCGFKNENSFAFCPSCGNDLK